MKADLKSTYMRDPHLVTFWKRYNYVAGERTRGYEGPEAGKDEEVEHRGFLRQAV